MQEIIILVSGPFLQRDYDRFGIELLKKNFIIKVLDFTAWTNPIFWKESLHTVYKCEEYLSISCKSDFLKFISERKSVIVINYMRTGYNRKINWVRKYLKKKNSLFVHLDTNLNPRENIKITRLLKKLVLLVINPKRFITEFYKFFYNRYNNLIKVYDPDVLVLGGTSTLNKTKIKNQIYAHSMDYDVYLSLKNKPDIKKTPYAVFLEDNMTDCLDYSLLDRLPPVEENQYFPILIKFLKKFELGTGLKVKFAIHPTSSKDFSNLLKDFEYYKANTAEIVKNSSLVFLHSSTAVSYAVLFNKPAVFLTSNELEKSWIGNKIVNASKVLNGKIINMNNSLDRNLDMKNLFNFDKHKYQEYKDMYIKFPNSPDVPLWEIFTKYIKKFNYNKTI